ncbi:MAG: hypothetical protein RL477_366 [Pseudomonadota bacterium]
MRKILALMALLVLAGCVKDRAYTPVVYDKTPSATSTRMIVAIVKTGEVTGGETTIAVPVSPTVMVPMEQVSPAIQFNPRDQIIFLLNFAQELDRVGVAKVVVPTKEDKELKSDAVMEIVFLRTHANAYRNSYRLDVGISIQSARLKFQKRYVVDATGEDPADGKRKAGLALMHQVVPDIEEFLKRDEARRNTST